MNVTTAKYKAAKEKQAMATFTINEDNNITAFATAAEAAQAGDSTTTTFESQAALAKVSDEWPLSRFVEIYNGISGNAELKKFQDRKKAVARVWVLGVDGPDLDAGRNQQALNVVHGRNEPLPLL